MDYKYIDNYVVLQFLILAAILISTPFTFISMPLWVKVLSVALFILGCVISSIGYLQLGLSFTPAITPKDDGRLVTSGIYGQMRHPMYTGLLFCVLGWTCFWGTMLGIILWILLCFALDAKAREEEKLLTKKYPEYADYKVQVKKFIPFIY